MREQASLLLALSPSQSADLAPRERKIPGSNPVSNGFFSGSSHTSDLKIDTQVATLPRAWRYRVSAGTS